MGLFFKNFDLDTYCREHKDFRLIDDASTTMSNVEIVYNLCKDYYQCEDLEVKGNAIQAILFLFSRLPQLMTKTKEIQFLSDALRGEASATINQEDSIRLQRTVLQSLTDFLTGEEKIVQDLQLTDSKSSKKIKEKEKEKIGQRRK